MAAVKHIFIINPAAGKCDRTNQVAASIRAAAMELGVDYEILTTEYPRHAVSQVRQKAEEYPDRPLRFYACGGDGTLNEVAAGAAGLPNWPSPIIPPAAATILSSSSGQTAGPFPI